MIGRFCKWMIRSLRRSRHRVASDRAGARGGFALWVRLECSKEGAVMQMTHPGRYFRVLGRQSKG
jgi:hypothetical protein